jgi:predicted nucleic acid-binding protein
VRQAPLITAAELKEIEAGEREAIMLAEDIHADLVLLDDLHARQLAKNRGLRVIGKLGVLADAARSGLIDFSTAIDDLKLTNFRVSDILLNELLDELK